MSLSSLIREREVRDRLRAIIKRPPKGRAPLELLAPPQSSNYQAVGIAFDYLLRFGVQRINPRSRANSWIAEDGLKALKDGEGRTPEINVENFERSITRWFTKEARIVAEARSYLQEARQLHTAFMAGAAPTDGLLKSAIRLAYLDLVFRDGGEYFDIQSMRSIKEENIADLWRLLSLVNPGNFRANKACHLNPTFGGASRLVRGADADLLIDGRLIEIKTTSKSYVRPETFDQLVGYYFLLRLGGMDIRNRSIDYDREICRIEFLEVYMSRFGTLQVFPIKELVEEEEFRTFAAWLVQHLIGRRPEDWRHLAACNTNDAVEWCSLKKSQGASGIRRSSVVGS